MANVMTAKNHIIKQLETTKIYSVSKYVGILQQPGQGIRTTNFVILKSQVKGQFENVF